jgi:2-haloacid dehalogenase
LIARNVGRSPLSSSVDPTVPRSRLDLVGASGQAIEAPDLEQAPVRADRELGDFPVLSFDCYGTLVDRDTGIVDTLLPWLQDAGVTAGRGEILRAFFEAERHQLTQLPGMLYSEALAQIHYAMAEFFGVRSNIAAAAAFAASVKDWAVHPDVPAALAYLKRHFRLAVLTNADLASFKATNRRLGTSFDVVCSAEHVGSYKPDPRNFAYLLDQLGAKGVRPEQVLHVAGSLRVDHVPAKRQGLSTCWIRRRRHRAPVHNRQPIDIQPDFRFATLGQMAEAHAAAFASIQA